MSLPVLDLSHAADPSRRGELLAQLRDALFSVGFLYVTNHGIDSRVISDVTARLPALFDMSQSQKEALAKLNSPHFLGYSAFGAEVTQGQKDLREQFDFASELPVIYSPQKAKTNGSGNGILSESESKRDFSKPYWRLRGPNQWPPKTAVPGFREALLAYHAALSDLSYRFVHLVEEAFGIPHGTFDGFFHGHRDDNDEKASSSANGPGTDTVSHDAFLPPQHRLKLIKYHPSSEAGGSQSQGVGAHKDSSGWLTFLYQVDEEPGLEVLGADGETWIAATPIAGSFVVNFGNAFEAATEGAVRATIHRVQAPAERVRYSIPFFMGLPLDMTVSEIQSYIPLRVRAMRREASKEEGAIPSFLDAHWDNLGDLQLRKWIRSHPDVARRWYEPGVVAFYTT